MPIHHLTIAVRGRLALARDEAERRALVRTVARVAAELEERFSDIQRANAGAFADEVVRRDIPAHLEEGAPETDAMREAIERYGELAALAREGVTRERCDWEHPLEQGQRARLPIDIKSARLAGLLLYLEARRSRDTSQTLQRSVELIAFGRDLLRHPSLILGMTGLAVQSYGYRDRSHARGGRLSLGPGVGPGGLRSARAGRRNREPRE